MLEAIFKEAGVPAGHGGLIRGLGTLGWMESGTARGERTRVFVNPHASDKEPSAIRINVSQDYGFYNYAQLCIDHPSPHFQKIYEHGFLEDGVTHVTLSEQLHPAPAISKTRGTLRSELHAFWTLADYTFPHSTGDGIDLDEEEINRITLPIYDEATLRGHVTALRDISPTLADAVGILQSCQLWLALEDPRYTGQPFPDFSPSNIMIRKGNATTARTIVLADPFAYDALNDQPGQRNIQYDVLEKVFGQPSAEVRKSFVPLPTLKI